MELDQMNIKEVWELVFVLETASQFQPYKWN